MRLIVAISLLIAFGSVAAGQDRFPIPRGPHWSAAELRAAHSYPYSERELQIIVTFRRDQEAAEKASILSLGPDYVSVISESGQTIIDTKLKRFLQVDGKARGFRNSSLYASADFVRHLLEERTRLRETLEGAGAEEIPIHLRPFWIESHLGAESNRKAPLDLQKIDHNDGSASALLDGEVVAIWNWSRAKITAEQQSKFRLYLQYHLKLHPRIRRAILEELRLPTHIKYTRLTGEGLVEEEYRFQLSQKRSAAFPLAEDLEPLPETRPDNFHREVYPLMLAAVSGRVGRGPKAIETYVSDVWAAVGHGAMDEAWLTLLEATLHYQPRSPVCAAESAEGASDLTCFDKWFVQNVMLEDERVRGLQEAMSPQLSGKHTELTVKKLLDASREKFTKSYIIDVFLGNAVSRQPELMQVYDLDAAELIIRGIEKNPYIPSFYKDLGDHFARDLDFVRAYLCYDLGRALPDGAGSESLQLITMRERELELSFPEFF